MKVVGLVFFIMNGCFAFPSEWPISRFPRSRHYPDDCCTVSVTSLGYFWYVIARAAISIGKKNSYKSSQIIWQIIGLHWKSVFHLCAYLLGNVWSKWLLFSHTSVHTDYNMRQRDSHWWLDAQVNVCSLFGHYNFAQ